MTASPKAPPEARLIRRLREAFMPPLSMREAARRAGFSVATWTQNENGYRKVTPVFGIPIVATDEKLARMAQVVGATPQQLRDTGRHGAAKMLQKLIDAGPDPKAQMVEKIRQSRDFTQQQKEALIEAVMRGDG